LSTAADADVSIDFVEQGCFHHRKSTLELKAHPLLSTLRVELSAVKRSEAASSTQRTLPPSDGRSVLAEIIKIIEQGDGTPQCESTSGLGVTVKWSCAGVQREAHFGAPGCGGGSDTQVMDGFRPYEPMRADGLFALARRLANTASH
jgi:hypothetical protein